MRCKSCNTILNDGELSRKEADTGDFIDLCGRCYSVSERAAHNYDIDASDFDVEFNNGEQISPWLQ
jgi:hypothetical protein